MKEKKKKPIEAEDTPIPKDEFKDILDLPISMLNPDEEEFIDPVDEFITGDIESNIQREWVRELYEQKIKPGLSKPQDNETFEEILGDWKKDYSQRRINKIPYLKDAEVFGKIIVKRFNGHTLFSVPYRLNRSLQTENLGYVHIFIGSGPDRVFHIDTRGSWSYKVKVMNLRHEVEARLKKFGRKYQMLKRALNGKIEAPDTLEKAEEYFVKFEETGDGDYSNPEAFKHLHHSMRILEYAEPLYQTKNDNLNDNL